MQPSGKRGRIDQTARTMEKGGETSLLTTISTLPTHRARGDATSAEIAVIQPTPRVLLRRSSRCRLALGRRRSVGCCEGERWFS